MATRYEIVQGSLDAKLGREETLRLQSNNNGFKLAEFTASNNLRIKSTKFDHKNIHNQTWVSTDGKIRNQTDHIIVDARPSSNFLDVRSFRKDDGDI